MTCVLCRQETTGSRGPASNYLRPLCSPCASQVDGEILRECAAQPRHMDRVLDLLSPRPVIEMETVA